MTKHQKLPISEQEWFKLQKKKELELAQQVLANLEILIGLLKADIIEDEMKGSKEE